MAKTKYTAGPYTPPLAHVDVHSVIIPIPRQKKIPVAQVAVQKDGGEGGGVKREHCLAGERDSGTFAGRGLQKFGRI